MYAFLYLSSIPTLFLEGSFIWEFLKETRHEVLYSREMIGMW